MHHLVTKAQSITPALTAISSLLETPDKAKNLQVMLFRVAGMLILLAIYVAPAHANFIRRSAD
ncbi:hypothetical protein B2G74_28655 [Burkholderia sp. A27]|nr:hypothetical protein B2G74_28655 [Burkholderia sp. A27]